MKNISPNQKRKKKGKKMIMSKTTNKISLSLNLCIPCIYCILFSYECLPYSISYSYLRMSSECLTCPCVFTSHHTFHSSSLLSSEIQLVSLCNSYSDHESSHLCYTDTSQTISKHLCHSWNQVVSHFLSHNNI